MGRLKEVEKEILKSYREIGYNPSGGIIADERGIKFDLFRHELKKLEKERQFLLDRRESWLPKTLWTVLVPIIISIAVSVFTPYLLKHLGMELGK